MAKETDTLNSYSIVSAGTLAKGEFHTPGNVRIDGNFEGNISTKGRLIVGSAGVITGTIICQNAEIEGNIHATIDVEQHLALKSTAKLIGDVKANTVSIEAGALFQGRCQMKEGKQKIVES